eukprot:139345_1
MTTIQRFLTHDSLTSMCNAKESESPPSRPEPTQAHTLIMASPPKFKPPIWHITDSPITDNLLRLTPTKPESYAMWTPRQTALYLQDKFPAGSIKGSVFTLIICIVGSGALSIPWAFRMSGVLLGTILLIVASFFSFLSLHFLVYSGLYIQERPSYRNLALRAGGKCLATYTSLNLMCNLFGSTVSYFVALGGILNVVYGVLFQTDDSIYQELVFLVAFVVVFPMSLMRSMNSIRFGSLIGIVCLIYLGIVIFIDYFKLCDDNTIFENLDIERHSCFFKPNFDLSMDDLFQFTGHGFLSSFPIFVFAYACQPNVLPIYIELQRRSMRRMHKVIRRAIFFSGSLYLVIGVFGYLTFMDGTCGNILQNDFKQHLEVILSAVTISVSITITLPMLIYALRENVTLFTVNKVQVHWAWHTILTLVLIGICATVAAEATELNVVLGFLGCTTNPSVAYFLPNFFFLRLVPRHKAPKRWWLALISMVVLLLLSAASFVFQIYAMNNDSVNPATTCSAAQEIA